MTIFVQKSPGERLLYKLWYILPMLSTMSKLETRIINRLQKKSRNTVSLIDLLISEDTKTTKQGVYKAIGRLKSQEIVITNAKRVGLSSLWIRKMSDFFSIAGSRYLDFSSPETSFLSLQDGESVSYTFRSAVQADQFWDHAIILLLEQSPQTTPVFFENYHYWHVFSRRESETELYEYIKRTDGLLLNTSYSNLLLDKVAKNMTNQDFVRYSYSQNPDFKKNYYLTMVGDVIADGYFDKKTTDAIEKIYTNNDILSDSIIQQLDKITNRSGHIRTRFTKNTKRAQKLRRKLSQNFLIPKKFRDNV